MGLFSFFKKKQPPTASLAKERLKIIVEHSRADAKHPKYLNKMRQEILDVVRKYVNIEIDDIDTNISNQAGAEVLELNISLPEGAEGSEISKNKPQPNKNKLTEQQQKRKPQRTPQQQARKAQPKPNKKPSN